jgi:RNA polymerase sigma-70 factor (ECF subfamily)
MQVTDSMSDQVLSQLVRAGNADAFGVLVERHMRRAYLHALGFVGSREDALDLSQEAFARAYRARHTLDPNQPFYAWLYQILRRLCFNFLRDARAHRRLMDGHSVDWVVRKGRAAESDPALAVERAETTRMLAEAIDRLPAFEREVLVLKEFEELKYREIADLIGVPIGTVMSRLYAARRRLAAVLETRR